MREDEADEFLKQKYYMTYLVNGENSWNTNCYHLRSLLFPWLVNILLNTAVHCLGGQFLHHQKSRQQPKKARQRKDLAVGQNLIFSWGWQIWLLHFLSILPFSSSCKIPFSDFSSLNIHSEIIEVRIGNFTRNLQFPYRNMPPENLINFLSSITMVMK